MNNSSSNDNNNNNNSLILCNKLISELKNTNYWQLLFKEEAELIFFGGSTLCNTRDDFSDFDIDCITSTKNILNKNKYNEYLEWNGKKIHMYYHSLYEINSKLFYGIDLNFMINLYLLCERIKNKDYSMIIYCSNDKLIKLLINRSEEFLNFGFKELVKANLYKIELISSGKNFIKSKWLYYLIYAKKLFFKEELDMQFLKQIKRIEWQPVKQKYLDMCVQDIKEIKDWYEKEKVDEN